MTASRLRFGHFAPYALPATVSVDGERVLSDLSYGRVAAPVAVEAGSRSLLVTSEGETLVEADVEIPDDGALTVLFLGPASWVTLPADDGDLELGRARLRFVNLAHEDVPVDVSIRDGATLAEDLTYGEATAFRTVKADPYEFQVRSADDRSLTTLPEVELDGQTAHTIVLHARRADGPVRETVIRDDASGWGDSAEQEVAADQETSAD